MRTTEPIGLLDQPLLEGVAAFKKVCVVGLGYVGLPTALLFAKQGFTVTGVDIDASKRALLEAGNVAAIHPELTTWWEAVSGTQRFSVSASPVESDVFLIAVPTPVDPHTRGCDLSAVVAAVASILPVLRPGNLVVLESTVPPGTTRNRVRPLLEATGLIAGKDFSLCFTPERVLPGNTTKELVNNHRVIGGLTPRDAAIGKAFFETVIEGELFLSDDVTAEFCKLAENTYRDVNIALANELATIADELGIDIHEAIPLINQHPRVNVLKPGIGVGGHCIAVDPWFFVEVSPWRTELIATSRRVNDRMPAYCAQKILDTVKHIEHPRLCLAGLTYKPNVADTRESPAMRMVQLLQDKGVDVTAFDPLLPEDAGKTLLAAAAGADYLGVLVPHDCLMAELSDNRKQIAAVMRTPIIQVF